jgi:putative ABC transport system permease protein
MIPFSYSIRNLKTRRLTTILTVSGMALVVFVFATILMLTAGLKKTLVETGSYDNVVVIRKSSVSEVQSGVDRDQASIVETNPEVALGPDGKPVLAKEIVVLIGLPKAATHKDSNVTIRGISEQSIALRPQVRIIKGRMPKAGSTEIATGSSITKRFEGANMGDTLRFGTRNWRVVGVFDAGNTGFNSEIWADADQLMQSFKRPVYSSVLFRLRDPSQFDALKSRIETDPRLTLEAKRETRYYLDQSEMMAKFLNVLGVSLTIIFSLGAIIGAMITMYSAVANRTAEIGTMRALGFQKMNILGSFLVEALLLGFLGGIAGLFFASFLQFFFALIMGFVGGVLPAFRAARMNIVESLRTR